jgi:ketosteroid isomerase-like protein
MTGSTVAGLQAARLEVLEGFAAAYNRHDLDAIMAYFVDNAVFEGFTGPNPYGERFIGREAVSRRVEEFLERVPDAQWVDAKHSVAGDRGFSEWTYTGSEPDGTAVRRNGIDVIVFDGARIASKSTFQKRVG